MGRGAFLTPTSTLTSKSCYPASCHLLDIFSKHFWKSVSLPTIFTWRAKVPPSRLRCRKLKSLHLEPPFSHTFWNNNLPPSLKVWRWSEINLLVISISWRHYTPISIEKCKMFWNSFEIMFCSKLQMISTTTHNSRFHKGLLSYTEKFWIFK